MNPEETVPVVQPSEIGCLSKNYATQYVPSLGNIG